MAETSTDTRTRATEAAAAAAGPVSPLMRLAIEAGPLVVFFLANSLQGIMVGTAAFMVAMTVSVVVSVRLERRWPLMPIVSCFFVLLFGGLTLAFDDAIFIKLKPTVVNLLFAAILFSGLAFQKNVLKRVMGVFMEMDDSGWRQLTWRWACFFVVLAALNEGVWRSFSTDTWVSFKLFGIMPLTLLFGALQVPLIMKHQVGPASRDS